MENNLLNSKETQISQSLKKLEESELLNLSLVNQFPSGICVLNAETFMTEMVNDAFLEVSGKDRRLFEEEDYWTIFEEVADQFAPIMKNVIATAIPYRSEEEAMTLIRKGVPEFVYISFGYEPIKDSNGNVTKVMINATDVTAKVLSRKQIEQSEQNLRNTILQAPVGMAILRGKEYIVEIANERMYQIWGKPAN